MTDLVNPAPSGQAQSSGAERAEALPGPELSTWAQTVLDESAARHARLTGKLATYEMTVAPAKSGDLSWAVDVPGFELAAEWNPPAARIAAARMLRADDPTLPAPPRGTVASPAAEAGVVRDWTMVAETFDFGIGERGRLAEALEYAYATGRRDRLAEAGKAQAEWIAVSARLPEPGEPHLLYLSRKSIVRQGFRTSGKQWFLDDGDPAPAVTHWRPLPEGPSNSTLGEGGET